MTDEIRLTVGIQVTHTDGNNFRVPNKTTLLDQDTQRWGSPGVIAISTSEETVDFGDLTLPVLVVIRNLDATNFLKFGFVTGNLEGKVSPGGQAVFELISGGDLIVQADTAAVDAEIIGIMQD